MKVPAVLLRCLIGEVQLMSVREDYFGSGIAAAHIGDGRAIPGRAEDDSQLVAILDGSSRPACARQNRGTVRFDGPSDDFAALVCHIEIDLAVRIHPHKFRDDSFDGDAHGFVIRGVPMVGCS